MASFISSNFQLTSNQTALALVVPEHLQSEINSLRKLHDKSYRKWQPHINLIYPFVDPSSLSSAVTVLRKCLHNEEITSVQVNIDETGVFRHRKNATIFLKPSLESEENISQLRRILVKALGCDEKDGTHDGIFRPHMTIGQAGLNGTSIEKLVEQAEKLTGFGWEGKSLAVLQRENSGEMRMVAELPLESLGVENDDGDKHLSTDTGWRHCYSFTSDAGWSQTPRNTDTAISEKLIPEKVTIATYNLMAETFAPPFESRLKLIIEALSTVTASSTSSMRILCLQEVNEEMLSLILAETFIQTNFPYSTHMPSSLLPSHRNLITLASRPFKNFHLEFPERHKEALIISLSDFPLEVANIHLTSALTDKAVEVKRNQMETITNFFRDRSAADKEILVTGDFNLTTSSHTLDTAVSLKFISPETAQLVGSVINIDFWEDAFDSTGATSTDNNPNDLFEGEEGGTFDRLTNPLAAISESPIDNRPQRYDRVLFRKGGRLHPENYNIFGRPTEQGFCGSDHYGVSVTLRINQPGQSTSKTVDSSASLLGNIEVVEDSSDVQSLIEPYLPTNQDREHRQQALNLLHRILTSNSNIEDLVFAPLGSYLMDTYSTDSDVDLLIIGSVPAEVFFNFASAELRVLDTRRNGEFKGVHFVNSLVSIIEVSIIGIKFDLQYCQAPELLEKYHSTNNTPNLQTLVFDTALISSLPPSSIRPLNTYRDAAYLLNSLPDLPSYRAAHRFLSLYLKRRGLYSAKFGYLGGIHVSLMLNRIIKLIATNSNTENSGIESETKKISPATIIRTFFAYYANFDWANDNVTDPVLSDHGRNVSRSTRDAIFIYSIHKPTARPNVASSCTRLTAQTLTQEFSLATQKLQVGDWKWCIRPTEASVADFLGGFGAFIRVEVDVWDVNEIGGDKVREMVSGLESKFPRLLVALGRVNGLDGRFWPARLRTRDVESAENQFKGYYLAGVSCRDDDMDAQGKRLFTGKVITAMREFERSVKEAREMEGGNIWVSMEVIPKKKIADMDLIVDEMDWGGVEEPRSTNSTTLVPDESYLKPEVPSGGSNPQTKSHQRAHSNSLRPAQDIISRIHWDPVLSVDDFVIGYEDRFVGVKEIELGKWKSEQTDEEFIPRHRIVWVRRKGEDGEKVWDRRKKVDLIFGSGNGRGKGERA